MSGLADETIINSEAWQLFSVRKVISKVYTNNKTKRPVSTGRFVLEKSRADRFEPSNATVPWTVAGDGLTEPNLNFSFRRKENCNKSGRYRVPMIDI